MTLTGWGLTRQQLRALFTKRLKYALRSRRGFIAQVLGCVVLQLPKLSFTLFTHTFFIQFVIHELPFQENISLTKKGNILLVLFF